MNSNNSVTANPAALCRRPG
uniref:Uncharacterized protein n=1 Tax=Anguilla anguilla TaxID=7936 RepID=A0A0E9TFK0_ANGAN